MMDVSGVLCCPVRGCRLPHAGFAEHARAAEIRFHDGAARVPVGPHCRLCAYFDCPLPHPCEQGVG